MRCMFFIPAAGLTAPVRISSHALEISLSTAVRVRDPNDHGGVGEFVGEVVGALRPLIQESRIRPHRVPYRHVTAERNYWAALELV